ncbi:MAG TPA: geranylgeranyl reductase family protein [Acidimicrobiales bacterium]|nr:geranylgeranyl reductase family protein [Acidimicrobiales bacterium]
MAPSRSEIHDVLVVGGGPAGSSCAYWLADAGWDVVVVEKKHFPREKTCGDGLTPRAVRQLTDMGLAGALSGAHRYTGLRACAYGMTVELPWPDHTSFASAGYVITRHDLDQIVAERAEKAGATLWQGTEAVEPMLEEGPVFAGPGVSLPACNGATVVNRETQRTKKIRARQVVVADGANSRFGRALGTTRDRARPLGMALRGYYRSPRHDDDFIESHLDIRDSSGTVLPGYGWIFPVGDGRVNVGVGLLTVEGRWRGVNTSKLMESFVAGAPKSWGLSPQSSCGPPTGGKLPMGLSMSPRVGPTTLVIGDAAGAINPFNGEGIAYGYETGRIAASCIGRALAGEGREALADYEKQVNDAYGLYYQVARDFVKLIGQPRRMEACMRLGMRSQKGMEWLLRIMANLLRPGEAGPPELAYRALSAVARLAPRD